MWFPTNGQNTQIDWRFAIDELEVYFNLTLQNVTKLSFEIFERYVPQQIILFTSFKCIVIIRQILHLRPRATALQSRGGPTRPLILAGFTF